MLGSVPAFAFLAEQVLVVPQDPLILAIPEAPSLRGVGASCPLALTEVADALLRLLLVRELGDAVRVAAVEDAVAWVLSDRVSMRDHVGAGVVLGPEAACLLGAI